MLSACWQRCDMASSGHLLYVENVLPVGVVVSVGRSGDLISSDKICHSRYRWMMPCLLADAFKKSEVCQYAANPLGA